MTKEDLVSIIRAHRRDSLGVEDGDLSNERATALDHYHGRPYGNEQEGRSQVVSRDLAEAVDWIMPAIMRVFMQSGSLGEFDPVGPEDEAMAQQESEYTNQVIMKDNPGFLILHDAIKDTLLLKNGYVKHAWETKTKISEEEYSGLTMDEITMMIDRLEAEGAKVEIKGQESHQVIIPTPAGAQPLEVFDIRLQIKRKKGKVDIEATPTEEVRVSKRCRSSLQESPFTEHVTRKTRSDLIEMGMSKDFVYSLPSYDERDNSQQATSRDSVSDESNTLGSTIIDRSMDDVEYCEAYLKVDWDGDGIAELRKVVTVANRIPPGDEWNEAIDAVPMTGFIAKRMPHRHTGESLDDELADLQEIKTVLMRQLLDNIYLTNNNQWLVNERVNLTDMMQSLPGGIKRVSGREPVTDSVVPVMATPIVQQILPVVDYFDNVKEARTGISRASTGLDPDILKQTTKGAFMENLNRASQKVEMITRMLAETGVKELVVQVHGLLIRHQDKPRVVQMRGQWVNVNPQEWQERTDLTPKVGLGTGNEEDKRQKLLLLSGLQDKMAGMGMVGPAQAYALFEDVAKTMGFEVPEKYAMSPDSLEFQQAMQNRQPPPNPLVEVELVKGHNSKEAAEIEARYKQQCDKLKADYDASIKALEIEADERKAELESKTKIAVAEIGAKTSLKQSAMSINASADAEAPTELDENGEPRARVTLGDLVNTVNQSLTQVFQNQEGFAQQLAERQDMAMQQIMQHMAAPKPIALQRGPDGKVMAVNGRPVIRNPQTGRAEGLE